MLDAGEQPPSDLFPAPNDPLPDPAYSLVMVICSTCHLAQLESDPTTPDEPRGVEPAALVAQAQAALGHAVRAGYVRRGARVYEYPSPHGGSWVDQLVRHGMMESPDGTADLLVDVFGLMHEADQRAAMESRVSRLSDDGVLLMQFHTLAAILRSGTWNALRHGHFAYYSTPVLVEMGRELGLTAIGISDYPLYGGTVLLAFAKDGSRWGGQASDVGNAIELELKAGVTDPATASSLSDALATSVSAIQSYLSDSRAAGLSVSGYGAASRTSALLRCAGIGTDQVAVVADASPSKRGRTMPGSRIPIVSSAELVQLRPDRVLLFVPDLLPEVQSTLPEIEANRGRWVILDPMPREVQPVTAAGWPLAGHAVGSGKRRPSQRQE